MKTLVVIALAVLATAVAAAPAPRAFGPSTLYRAYWLVGPDKRRDYLTLMVSPWPVEELAGHTRRSQWLFDNTVMTFQTYERDSLWDVPFKPVGQVGAVDPKAKTVVLDGVSYTYEPGELKDVVRLLEKPLGTIPLHRPYHPLRGAEQTARAFRLLLLEQMEAAAGRGR
jgi:hypothetical protein